jgi:alkylhydroperoxidase family enzyme
MGHCEMLLEVGGLNAEQIAGRTRQMAESRWEAFAPAERTAFALAARLTADPASVTDEDLKPVLATHGEARTLDLIWWIARCQFMTKVSDAFQLSLERDNVFADFEPPQEKAAQPSR